MSRVCRKHHEGGHQIQGRRPQSGTKRRLGAGRLRPQGESFAQRLQNPAEAVAVCLVVDDEKVGGDEHDSRWDLEPMIATRAIRAKGESMGYAVNLDDKLVKQAIQYTQVSDLNELLNLALTKLVEQKPSVHKQKAAEARLIEWRKTCKIGDVISPLDEQWDAAR